MKRYFFIAISLFVIIPIYGIIGPERNSTALLNNHNSRLQGQSSEQIRFARSMRKARRMVQKNQALSALQKQLIRYDSQSSVRKTIVCLSASLAASFSLFLLETALV